MTSSRVPFFDLAGQHQALGSELTEAVAPLLREAAFIGGDPVAEFERSFAALHRLPHAVTVKSGTAALRLSLEALGLPEPARKGLERALAQPEGVILLTGPSGSGKTTTLYSSLAHIREQSFSRSMVSVEDPVERRIPGVIQTEINAASGLDFATALRSLLRQDPDVLLLGEIRDRETAAIALEAGLTGHLVAATIHAGTAPQVFARLLEMGVEPFVATTAVRGVLAQRLVRRVAPGGEGYQGRVLMAEWLEMGPRLRRAVLDRSDGDALSAAAAESGFPTLRDSAEQLIRSGVTTPEEVDRVLGDA